MLEDYSDKKKEKKKEKSEKYYKGNKEKEKISQEYNKNLPGEEKIKKRIMLTLEIKLCRQRKKKIYVKNDHFKRKKLLNDLINDLINDSIRKCFCYEKQIFFLIL